MPDARRRMHKKSRGGCRQCKARRVKCDESRPECQTCRRHGDDCDFTALRHLRRYGPLQHNAKPSSSSYSSSQTPAHPSQSIEPHKAPTPHPSLPLDTTRLLELRLLYNYMTLCTLIQSLQPQHTRISLTMTGLAQLSLTSPVLMDALLSISALSLYTFHPQDPVYRWASHTYALSAIRECSRQICAGVDEGNARPLFLASMLIAFHGFASRKWEGTRVEGGGAGGEEMRSLQWFRLFQGVRAVKEAGRPWIQGGGGPLGLLFNSLPSRYGKCEAVERRFFAFLLEGVEAHEEGVDGETRAAYEDAVAYLSYVRADSQLRGLLGFPVAVSKRFVDLLDGRDPTALAIVGNWLGLMRMSRLSSFLQDARERELDEIMQALPQEWWPKMSWAVSVPTADTELIELDRTY